jgi:hypothetical protein
MTLRPRATESMPGSAPKSDDADFSQGSLLTSPPLFQMMKTLDMMMMMMM